MLQCSQLIEVRHFRLSARSAESAPASPRIADSANGRALEHDLHAEHWDTPWRRAAGSCVAAPLEPASRLARSALFAAWACSRRRLAGRGAPRADPSLARPDRRPAAAALTSTAVSASPRTPTHAHPPRLARRGQLEPIGIMALWPLTWDYYQCEAGVRLGLEAQRDADFWSHNQGDRRELTSFRWRPGMARAHRHRAVQYR